MKKLFIAIAVLAGLTHVGLAELKISRSVYRMDQLKEASAKAIEKESPLVFIYTDPGST